MSASTVIRFSDRRSAYGFVSELRRLYELDRFVDARVQALESEVLVELPGGDWPAGLSDLVQRHRGRSARPAELDRLREAMFRARETQRQSTAALDRAREESGPAVDAVDRAGEWRPGTASTADGAVTTRLPAEGAARDAPVDPPEAIATRVSGGPFRRPAGHLTRRPAAPLPRPSPRVRRADLRGPGRALRRRL